MEKNKGEFIQSPKIFPLLKLSGNTSALNSKKNLYKIRLSKIFSSPQSHLGYKSDIESLINELDLHDNEILDFTIKSISKSVRRKSDINIITSYLYLLPEIRQLLNEDINKNKKDILNDLLTLSKSIGYEKYQPNTILMKFGDIGFTTYLLLDGQVNVLIKTFKYMNVTKNDYLFYLANLIKYYEYGLLYEVINENFSVLPLEIYDDNIVNEKKKFNKSFINNNSDNKKINYLNDNFIDKKNKSNATINYNHEEKNRIYGDDFNSPSSLFKLNEENERMKYFKSVLKISKNKLLQMFNFKQIDKKTKLNCSMKDYIKRIELIPDNYYYYLDKENDTNNDYCYEGKKIYNLKILNYAKVTNRGKGALLGEISLRNMNSVGTATIITSSECHCALLDKRSFDICLERGNEKYIKESLTFFVSLPIFNGLSESFFYHKYFIYLSKKVVQRGTAIISQGEEPKNIIILQTGIYGLTIRITLFDLTNLLIHFIKEYLKSKNKLKNVNVNEKEIKKYNKLMIWTKNLIKEAKSLMDENLKFKQFYLNEILIRVSDLSSPDMVGYKELVDEKGLYAFTLVSKSPENIIFTLDNKIYLNCQETNTFVRNNQKDFLERKISAIIKRLFIIRNNLINSFFEYKYQKELGSTNIKEIEDYNNSKFKENRFFKFKSTYYKKLDKKTIIEVEFEKKSICGNISNDNNNYKKKGIISRNKSLNKTFNSLNPCKQRDKKEINKLKKNIILNIKNIGKSLNNQYSSKRERDSFIYEKKKLINSFSKELSYLFLKDSNSEYNLKKKNNTESNSNENSQNKTNKIDKKKLLITQEIPSGYFSNRSREIKRINMNNMILEDILTKIKKNINNNNNFINKLSHSQRDHKSKNNIENSFCFNAINNEEIIPDLKSLKSSKCKIISNNNILRNKLLNNQLKIHRSLFELSINDNSKSITKSQDKKNYPISIYNNNNLSKKDNFYNYSSLGKNFLSKIYIKMNRFISSQKIKLFRELNQKRNKIINYHEKKNEKYKLDRKSYYNNNLKNRIKLFYNIKQKKIYNYEII